MSHVLDAYCQSFLHQMLDVCSWHRSIEKWPPAPLFRDKHQTGQFLIPLLIPDNDCDNIFVKFRRGILSRDLKLIGARGCRVNDVNFLIEFGRHYSFNVKPIGIEFMDSRTPTLCDGLSILCIRGNIVRVSEPQGKSKLSSCDDRIVHNLPFYYSRWLLFGFAKGAR